jgi:ubiquitin-protein ligase
MDFKEPAPELTSKNTKTIKKFSKRMVKEIAINKECNDYDFCVANNRFWYFRFIVKDGPYKGQVHVISVKLIYGAGSDVYIYPVFAPKCTFLTKIWHPNISEYGTICLDVLKDNWSPSMYTASIIDAIQLLLLNPEPGSPQNKSAAEMMATPKEYGEKISSFYNPSIPQELKDLF